LSISTRVHDEAIFKEHIWNSAFSAAWSLGIGLAFFDYSAAAAAFKRPIEHTALSSIVAYNASCLPVKFCHFSPLLFSLLITDNRVGP
jgi:hypothetical protein